VGRRWNVVRRLAVSGCGKSKATFSGQYALANSGSLMLPGDYATQVGNIWSSGLAYPQLVLFVDFKRVWDLSAPAWADPARLSTEASSLCGEAVTMTAFRVVSHTLKLNKRGTRAKVALEATGTALRTGGSSTLAYGVKAAGPW
jgi:hypothetical protein